MNVKGKIELDSLTSSSREVATTPWRIPNVTKYVTKIIFVKYDELKEECIL